MAVVILLLAVIFIAAIFSIQNALPVAVTFLFWEFEASLAIIVFLSMLCGMLAGVIIVSLLKRKASAKKTVRDSVA